MAAFQEECGLQTEEEIASGEYREGGPPGGGQRVSWAEALDVRRWGRACQKTGLRSETRSEARRVMGSDSPA